MSPLMNDIITTAHNLTVNLQEQAGTALDYSMESLAEIDELLEAFRGDALDEDALFNLSSMVGCYVFETARRCLGGQYFWVEEEQQPMLVAGLPDFSVGIKAWEKVRSRLTNGPADSIPFYIKGYQTHIAIGQGQKGYCVTIV